MELIHQLVIMQPLVAVVLVHLEAITQQAQQVVEDLVAMVLHHPYQEHQLYTLAEAEVPVAGTVVGLG